MKKTIEKKEEDMLIKVNLSVLDRIHFESILPVQGSLSEMDLAEKLVNKVDFSDAEKKEYSIARLPNGMVAYNPQKNELRQFRFESFELLYIQQGINEHDERKTLRRFNKDLAKKLRDIKVKAKEKI